MEERVHMHDYAKLLVDLRVVSMKATLNEDFAYAMTPMKILSWPVGTWPLQDYNIFSAMRVIITSFFLLLMLTIVQSEMYLDSNDAEKNLDALVILTCGILAVSKVIRFRIRPAALISNFTSAVEDYNELRDEEKRVIVRKHAYMARAGSVSMIFFAYFSSILFITVPMLAEEEQKDILNVTEKSTSEYPIPSENVMALVKIPDNLYFIVFIIEYLMLLFTSTGNLGSDSLFFGITFHLCGQVEILKLDFQRLKDESEKTREHFNVLTKRHIYLINLANMLTETISSILVMQLFTSCILICTSGLQLIIALSIGNIVMVVKIFIVLSALMVQLFSYSYVGEYLRRQMEGIGDSMYFCNWYDIPKSVAKDIIYVIMRAQDPVFLKAGQFLVVNMETYTSIIKTSMSYLSVLRVMIKT
ncbi:odorant receptor Or2-like [Bombus fervidus]|uniref:odorant receptor Or2-like n=1 Tax=Bombus fervidus TaxID=203811 RepID=UPI003AB45E92